MSGTVTPYFAVIIPVAGSEEDQRRLPDLLDSLWTYGPTVEHVLIIDDGPVCGPTPPATGNCRISRIPNARAGRGDGWSGGLCTAMISGFHYLHSQLPKSCRFILRLDTDSLIIAPFAARVVNFFDEHPDVAMIGSYQVSPNGKPRGYEYWGQLLSDMLRLWLRGTRRSRTGRRLPINLWGRPARLRRMIKQALGHGYVLGQSVQGGAYAISSVALRVLEENRYLQDPLLWLHTALVEDVMMSMLVKAAGMELAGFAADGEVFGVLHKGLPDIPERLLQRGYGIVHSIRNDPRLSEAEIRQFFQNKRHHTEQSANVDF